MATLADRYVQALVARNDAKTAQKRADIQAQYDAWEKKQRRATQPVQIEQVPIETLETETQQEIPSLKTIRGGAEFETAQAEKPNRFAKLNDTISQIKQTLSEVKEKSIPQVTMDENGMADIDSVKRNARATTAQRKADAAEKKQNTTQKTSDYPQAKYTADGKLDVAALQNDPKVQQMTATQTIDKPNETTKSTTVSDKINYYADKWLDPNYKMTNRDKEIYNELLEEWASGDTSDWNNTDRKKLNSIGVKANTLMSAAAGIEDSLSGLVNLGALIGKALGNDETDAKIDKYLAQRNSDIQNAYSQHGAATNVGKVVGMGAQYAATNALLGALSGGKLATESIVDAYKANKSLGAAGKTFGTNIAKQLIPDLLVDTSSNVINNVASGADAGTIAKDAAANILENAAYNALFELPGLSKATFEAGKDLAGLDKQIANLGNVTDAVRKANIPSLAENIPARQIADDVEDVVKNIPSRQIADQTDDIVKAVEGATARQAVEDAQKTAKEAVRENAESIFHKNPVTGDMSSNGNAVMRRVTELGNELESNPEAVKIWEQYIEEIEKANAGQENTLKAVSNEFADALGTDTARKNIDEVYNLVIGNELPKTFSGATVEELNPLFKLMDKTVLDDVKYAPVEVRNSIEDVLYKNMDAIQKSEVLQNKLMDVEQAHDKWVEAIYSGVGDTNRLGKDVQNAVNRMNTALKREGLDQIKVDWQTYTRPDYLMNQVKPEGYVAPTAKPVTETKAVAESIEPEAKMTIEPSEVKKATQEPIQTPDVQKVNTEDNVGTSRVVTNSALNSDIVTKAEIENDPVIKDIMTYEKHHNSDTLINAIERVDKHGKQWMDDVIAGNEKIGSDVDVDTAMILLKDLAAKAEKTTDPEQLAEIMGQRNALLSRLREFGTSSGQSIQAFAKWNNTADGAMLTAQKVWEDDVISPWVKKNQKAAKGNRRIAQALEDMGNKWKNAGDKAPLTHDQIKETVRYEIEKEMGSIEGLLNDNDLEYLAILAEDKSIPVWQITDLLEHKLKTGEWYSLDESIPVVKQKSRQLSSMLDNIVNGKKPKTKKPEETVGDLLTKIRNTLDDENSGVAGIFNDDDVYFIEKMMEEKVPKWQMEDELRHRLEHGTWYTLDESAEVKLPTNTKLNNALNSLIEGDVRNNVPEKPSLKQITEEVRNTLNNEAASVGEFTDDDVQYIANLINNGITKEELTNALNAKMATGSFGISADTQSEVNALFKYAEQFNPNSKEFVEAQAEAYRLLANELLPNATGAEKFNAWRYMAMLGNPKTMLRNYIGNKTFSVVTGISNNLAALGEAGIDKVVKAARNGEGIQRTKSVLNPAKDKGLISGSFKDADDSMYRFMVGAKYEKMDKNALRSSKSVFNSKVMQRLEEAVDKGISDYGAIKRKYSTSLAGYLKANGYDKSIFEAERELDRLKNLSETRVLSQSERAQMEKLAKETQSLEKAREFALKQAEYATFHEDNAIASALTKMSKNARESDNLALNLGGMLIEGLVPFKKTPANVLRSGIDYSPLGAIDSIRKTGRLIYENTGNRAGNLADTYEVKKLFGKGTKEVDKTLAADVIDSWSKTLTGTGLTALGAYLFNKGVLLSNDDDTSKQDTLEGKQNYSIKINGHTYTLDWAAPTIMPLLLGAEIAKTRERMGESSEEWYNNLDEYANAIGRIADPIVETSYLSGVKNAVEDATNAAQSKDISAIPALFGSAGMNYATQAIPTLFGQVARTVDNTRRSTYSDKEGIAGTIDRNLKRVENKIPFLSMQNQPYVDTYGRERKNSGTDNPLVNLAYQMLSPGYLAKVNTTDADKVSRDVYENSESQNTNLFPKYQSKVMIGDRKATPEEYTQYAKEYGKVNYDIRNSLANDKWFKGLDNAQKEEIMSAVNTIADHAGRTSVDSNFTSANKAYQAYAEGGVEGLTNYYKSETALDEYGISASSRAGETIKNSDDPYKTAKDLKEVTNIMKRAGLLDSKATQPTSEAVDIYNESGINGVKDYTMLKTNEKGGSYEGYQFMKQAIPSLTAKEYADIYNTYSVPTKNGNYNNTFSKDEELIPYLNSRAWDNDEQLNIVAHALSPSVQGTWHIGNNGLYYNKPSVETWNGSETPLENEAVNNVVNMFR